MRTQTDKLAPNVQVRTPGDQSGSR